MLYLTLFEFPSCWNCCWKIPHLLFFAKLEAGLTAGAIALRTPLASRSKLGFQLDRDQLDRGDVVTSFAAHV